MKYRTMVGLLLASIIATPVQAKEVTLVPSESVRIINPEDASDVRLLLKFTLTEDLDVDDVVCATLTVPTQGSVEELLSVGVVEQSWSGDSWAAISSSLSGSGGFTADSRHCLVTSNHLDLETKSETPVDMGMEVIVTEAVIGWLESGYNYGICIRRVAGSDGNISGVIPQAMATPQLQILYTR